MKRLLLATAAVIALTVAAPLATAQYTTPPPATAPYTTPLPNDPMTPQDESVAPQPDTTASQSQSATTTPGTPEMSAMPDAAATTGLGTTTAGYAQTQPFSAQTQTGMAATAQTYNQFQPTSPQAQVGPGGQTGTQTYGSSANDPSYASGQTSSPTYAATDNSQSYVSSSGGGENVATEASLEQHARDAGMDGMPMTAQAVCAPREISLTASGSRLNRDRQHQLINAADRASVCEIQRIVIDSPNGRADQARQLLVANGVDASKIEVQETDSGGLQVNMQFAGVATSSAEYAQMFNTQQYASYQPSTTGPSYGPSTSTPGYQPNAADQTMGQPTTPDSMDDDATSSGGMSPTSGDAAPTHGFYDI